MLFIVISLHFFWHSSAYSRLFTISSNVIADVVRNMSFIDNVFRFLRHIFAVCLVYFHTLLFHRTWFLLSTYCTEGPKNTLFPADIFTPFNMKLYLRPKKITLFPTTRSTVPNLLQPCPFEIVYKRWMRLVIIIMNFINIHWPYK